MTPTRRTTNSNNNSCTEASTTPVSLPSHRLSTTPPNLTTTQLVTLTPLRCTFSMPSTRRRCSIAQMECCGTVSARASRVASTISWYVLSLNFKFLDVKSKVPMKELFTKRKLNVFYFSQQMLFIFNHSRLVCL